MHMQCKVQPRREIQAMTPQEHLKHVAPLKWLAQVKLHPGETLADHVRAMRHRRRKANVESLTSPQPPKHKSVKV